MVGSWLKESLLSETPVSDSNRIEARLGRTIGSKGYTGEKNLGEMGPLREYYLEYTTLRARSWQLFLESEILQTIYGKYETYVIGKGIKLQSEPVKVILGLKVDIQNFAEMAEAKFALYSKSKRSDYSGMTPLNRIQLEAYKNSKIGGDVLVILRVDSNENVTVQLIDGAHVVSPRYGNEGWPENLPNGHRIVEGIELNDKNQHVAYYVRKDENHWDTQRVPARNSRNGMLMAYMVYGYKYRIDNYRGMPLMAVMFETIAKMDRYKEAAVGSAEERQKIAFTIEHDIMGTGENPYTKQTVRAFDQDYGSGMIPIDENGNQIADKMGVSTNKQVINMPRGAKAIMHQPANETSFADFYKTNFSFISAANRISPEVALSSFNANYSASRASLNDWVEVSTTEQEHFGSQFLKPIYDLFVHILIMKGHITSNDYVISFFKKNHETIEAFLNIRYVGPRIKHIDPLKEVKAEREKLGPLGAHLPLTTVENAVENLAGGDSDSNMEQFSEEIEMAKGLKLKPIEPKPTKQTSA
jgi:capsid protein